MFQVNTLATIHALATLGVGLWWAINGRLEHVAYTGAYIVGSEVLWRMTQADIFWEYGKYALVLIFVVALIRTRRIKGPLLPLFYFLLLIPSVWFTFEQVGAGLARQLVSFNLSGPLSLLACAWFFSQVRLTHQSLRRLILAYVAPAVGVVTNAIFNTVTAANIEFVTASNAVTSGGFGPNQVASILGLGAVMVLFYLIFSRKSNSLHKGMMLTVLFLFVFQAALTFSRGGLAVAFGAAVAASFFLFRDTRSRTFVVVLTVLLYLFTQYVMLPVLDDFTGGVFTQRYTDTTTSGRDEIALVDLQIFMDHPILGVGPGRGSIYRELLHGAREAAHTEFTRLLAEHGMLGLFALLLGILAGWRNLVRATTPQGKALVAAMLVWTLLFMLINGFRIAAPAFAFGLTFAPMIFHDRNRAAAKAALGSTGATRPADRLTSH